MSDDQQPDQQPDQPGTDQPGTSKVGPGWTMFDLNDATGMPVPADAVLVESWNRDALGRVQDLPDATLSPAPVPSQDGATGAPAGVWISQDLTDWLHDWDGPVPPIGFIGRTVLPDTSGTSTAPVPRYTQAVQDPKTGRVALRLDLGPYGGVLRPEWLIVTSTTGQVEVQRADHEEVRDWVTLVPALLPDTLPATPLDTPLVRLDQATPEALRAAVFQLVYAAIGRFANGESMQDQVDTALKCLRAHGEDMAELETQHVVDDVEPDTAAGLFTHERVSVWGPTDGDKTSTYLCPSGQNPIVVRGEDADYMGYLYLGVAAARLLAARLLSAAERAERAVADHG